MGAGNVGYGRPRLHRRGLVERKNFSPSLYAKNDTRARKAIQRLLESHGWRVVNAETCGVDLLAHKHGTMVQHEVEIKNVWDGEWPKQWTTIQIPERKSRLFQSEDQLVFWVVSQDTGMAWGITAQAVRESPLVEVPNRFVDKGERFYQVPIDKALLVRLD